MDKGMMYILEFDPVETEKKKNEQDFHDSNIEIHFL